MFFKYIFLLTLLLVASSGVFAQDNSVAEQTESTNIGSTVVQGENFFDILPVDENITESQSQPAFLDDLQNRGNSDNITSVFVRAIVGFIFFFALLFVAYKYLRNRSKNVLGSNDVIKILATTPLGQNKSLSIVEIVGNIYFISSTDRNITMMSEITDKDTKDAIRIASAKSSENVVDETFSSMFDKALLMFNIKKKKDDNDAIETTKEITEKIRTMDSDVDNYLNNQNESVGNNTSISFDKINRYVQNNAVTNASSESVSEDNSSSENNIEDVSVPKKRVSKKSSKK